MALQSQAHKVARFPVQAIHSAENVAELKQQSNRLQHLLQVMPAGVVVLDDFGQVQQANRVAIELLGEPLEGQLWRNIIARSFRPQADDGHEVSLFDGRKVKLSITPLEEEGGQLIVLTDLTETRQLQQRISHMQRLSSLGKMVASLAHQVRTPLSAAMLYASNLANATLQPKSREQFADKLMSRLKDLEQQVNDMLLFAKSGDQQVVEEISLQSLMLEVHAGAEAMLNKQNCQFELVLPEPDIIILGNKTALAGALQNLIHNSLQAGGTGLSICLKAVRDPQRKDQVLLSVTDNGPGIKQELQHNVFEPFYTTRSQGTGLGLAVVSSVAKSHKGKVSLRSNPGEGCHIELCLPLLKQQITAEQFTQLRSQA